MPYIAYKSHNFRAPARAIIRHARSICEEYAAMGYDLTLRQLYYQFVARGYIANSQAEYNRLGSTVNDARMAGLIDWDHIVDRTRNMEQNQHWTSPADILRQVSLAFRYDTWQDQPYHVEVWVEKEALAGVVEQVTTRLDVPSFACRGYVSQSEMWAAAQRMLDAMRTGKTPVVVHLGDHDPSGIDMTRDNMDRLTDFIYSHALMDLMPDAVGSVLYRELDEALQEHWRCGPLEINRIALNMAQVEEYNPPPNPAKLTDSRSGDYVAKYGYESWELDALPPDVLATLIEDAVVSYRDDALWDAQVARQGFARSRLASLASEWEDEG